MSEEQLERSILERKASDELRAIATAMSLEPVARTRKADLVNQILRAAGVEVDDATAEHRRERRLRRAADNGAVGPDSDSEAAAKPARGRTSRARSRQEGHGGRLRRQRQRRARRPTARRTTRTAPSAGSVLVNGSVPAAGGPAENDVAEAAAAILASSDSERGHGDRCPGERQPRVRYASPRPQASPYR